MKLYSVVLTNVAPKANRQKWGSICWLTRQTQVDIWHLIVRLEEYTEGVSGGGGRLQTRSSSRRLQRRNELLPVTSADAPRP